MKFVKYVNVRGANMTTQMIVDLSAENLVTIVAERTYNAIAHAWKSEEAREPHIVLTGGRTGLAIAKAVDLAIHRGVSAHPEYANKRVHIWFSDERFVEGPSEDRSDSILISGFTRSAAQCIFHRVAFPGECSLDEAAAGYAADLAEYLGTPGTGANFDVTILSMGEDGHIASLFPGDSRALNSDLQALAVDNSPKPPAQRVSIGAARLASSSAIYIFAVGESKREKLQEILDGTDAGPISTLRSHFVGNQLYLVTDIRL